MVSSSIIPKYLFLSSYSCFSFLHFYFQYGAFFSTKFQSYNLDVDSDKGFPFVIILNMQILHIVHIHEVVYLFLQLCKFVAYFAFSHVI